MRIVAHRFHNALQNLIQLSRIHGKHLVFDWAFAASAS